MPLQQLFHLSLVTMAGYALGMKLRRTVMIAHSCMILRHDQRLVLHTELPRQVISLQMHSPNLA